MGHSSTNCHLSKRCVKCAGNHPHGECTLDKVEPRDKLTCVNCGEQGHPASYMGCPYLKIAQDLKRNSHVKRQESKRSAIIKHASLVRPNTSYASLLHKNAEGNAVTGYNMSQPIEKRHEDTSQPTPSYNYRGEIIPNSPINSEQEQNIINKLINQLKDDITAAITTQFMKLEKKIANNTSKIEFVLSQLFQNV